MTKLTAVFRNFGNAPKEFQIRWPISGLRLEFVTSRTRTRSDNYCTMAIKGLIFKTKPYQTMQMLIRYNNPNIFHTTAVLHIVQSCQHHLRRLNKSHLIILTPSWKYTDFHVNNQNKQNHLTQILLPTNCKIGFYCSYMYRLKIAAIFRKLRMFKTCTACYT